MKKLFVSVLAIASMVACMNEETVRVQDPAAIGFDADWVENATRANEAVDPSTTTESLSGFDVWGYMDKTAGVIFEGEDVRGEKGNFTYMNTAYWTPNHTYYFSALAPMNSENVVVTPVASGEVVPAGLGVVAFENKKGAEDLLYAFAEVDAPAAGQNKVVNFTFKHLLSKVKFSFTNGFTNPNNTIDVKNVKMTVPAKGSINLNAADYVWENLNGELTLAFGDACAKTAVTVKQEAADERLTIPADAEQEYVISFDVVLYNGGVEAYKGTKTSTVTGVALEMGKAYNFAATLNASNFTEKGEELMPIEFDVVEVEDWVEAGDVATVLPGDINGLTLVTDAVAKQTLFLEDAAFDGAGHTLTAENVNVISSTARLIQAKGDATVRNLNIDGGNLVIKSDKDYGIRAFFLVGEGNYVIDNVHIANVTYPLNDDGAVKTLKVINSTFEGWTSFNAAATFENVTFKTNTVNGLGRVRPYGATTFKNCVFEEGFVIDLDFLKDNAVKFEGCTYAGRALTSADVINTKGADVEIELVVTEKPANNGLVQNVEDVKNMTIDGGNYTTTDGKGLRGIYITEGGVYNVDNVIVKNVTYAINVNTKANVELNVSNSTLEGWTSYGDSTTATFNNVKFECGTYANYKPYSSTVLTDCEFEAGFQIDFTEIKDGETLTFVNCKYAGVVLTAENFGATVNFDGDFAGKIAF